MELRHIYKLAELINDEIEKKNLPSSAREDIIINVQIHKQALLSIDKELYRISHDDKMDGFTHQERIVAQIDGIMFDLCEKPLPSNS